MEIEPFLAFVDESERVRANGSPPGRVIHLPLPSQAKPPSEKLFASPNKIWPLA